MKALTVWQPWASLIAIGAKPYEFRGWPAPRSVQGQRIAIHAGARQVRKAEVADLIVRLKGPEPWSTALHRDAALELLEKVHAGPQNMMPLSAVVCTAILGKPVPGPSTLPVFGAPAEAAHALDSDRLEHANWAWPLTHIDPYLPPLAAKGALGFWEFTA